MKYYSQSEIVEAISHTGFNYNEIHEFWPHLMIDPGTGNLMVYLASPQIIERPVRALLDVGYFLVKNSDGTRVKVMSSDEFHATYKAIQASSVTSEERNKWTDYGVVWNTSDPRYEGDQSIQDYHKNLGFFHWYTPDGPLNHACFMSEYEAFQALIAIAPQDKKPVRSSDLIKALDDPRVAGAIGISNRHA